MKISSWFLYALKTGKFTPLELKFLQNSQIVLIIVFIYCRHNIPQQRGIDINSYS